MSTPSQVEAIFFAALDRKTAGERSNYLNETCEGDVELRRRVDRLLDAYPLATDFLAQPAVERHAIDTRDSDDPTETLRFDFDCDDTAADDLSFLAPADRSDSLGRIGHYEVLQVLGRGGFGIVLRAFDDILKRVVAIKVLAPQLAATSPARKRFLREARSSAKVRHKNIVQVHSVEERPLPYLVMEYIPGETLQQRLDRTGPLGTDEIVQIGVQVAEGLAAAHAQGLIHRDIKPTNILLETGPQVCVKITDFGLARAADDASVSQSGIIVGTPMYMAPEQAQGHTLDHRADLFSFGSVLYTMCSGRPPFRASTTIAALKRVTEETPRPIPEIIPEVPQWLCDIVTRLHAKQPEDRIGTANEVADLLSRGQRDLQRSAAVPTDLESKPALVGEKQTEMVKPAAVVAIAKAAEFLKPATEPEPRSRTTRWSIAVALVALSVMGLGLAEASGVTNLHATIIRLFSPEGTLVVEVDDPSVSVKIDGSEIVITGAGPREIRLKPGKYTVEASKDGKFIARELVTVVNNGRKTVRITQEPADSIAANADGKKLAPKTTTETEDVTAWEQSVAVMPAAEQVKAVSIRMTALNPQFDGTVTPAIENGVVVGLRFATEHVSDISPIRVFTGLKSIICCGDFNDFGKQGLLKDLSPLKGMPLTTLFVITSPIADLSPLKGMSLTDVNVERTQVSDLSPLAGMPLHDLNIFSTRVTNLSPLQGMPLASLLATATRVADLSPLQGMPLRAFQCVGSEVSDLSPLRESPLQVLLCDGSQVSDLSPLKGMPLRVLGCGFTQVFDLSPLTDLPLEDLNCVDTKVTDLAPLKKMPLKVVTCNIRTERDTAILRSITTLQRINDKPAGQFWKEIAAGPSEFNEWLRQTSALPANQQVASVVAQLKERNPGFDGQMAHKIEVSTVTEIGVGPNVSDISPVRALVGLKSFRCNQLAGGRIFADLSPLKDMKLTSLTLSFTSVTDLSPLQGMNLTTVNLWGSPVSNLSPLAEMKLTELDCSVTNVSDLSPLRNIKTLRALSVFQTPVADLSALAQLKLTTLNFGRTGVTDLSPLKEMKLTSVSFRDMEISDLSLLQHMPLTLLDLHRSPVADLSPLKDMKLTELDCSFTKVTDLSTLKGMLPMKKLTIYGTSITDLQPLDGMALEEIRLTPGKFTQGLDILRDMKSLKIIGIDANNAWESTEFWTRYDNGEFKK